MKNKLFLSLLVSLFAVSAWAADVSVVERFSQINQTSAVASDSWPGDVCNWSTSYTRHQQPNYSDANYSDYITIGTTNMVSTWMSYASSTKQGVFQTTDLEGGIKAVSFNWAQFGKETSNTMNLEVKAGTITDDPNTNTDLTYTGAANKASGGIAYSKLFECKSNAQLSIKNISTQGGTAACRILIGDITITPYLLYTQKKVVISPSQTGYVNAGLIDNTAGEGSITYSIHDKDAATQNVAEINPSNGAITPKAIGKAVVTATWSEGVTTTYELIVANMVIETFSGVTQTSVSGSGDNQYWDGDICRWQNKYARRGTNDLINSAQASWLKVDGSTRGMLKTTNLEGGLLGVSFKYAQFGAEANTVLIWKMSDGADANWVVRDGDLGGNKNTPDTYSYAFENKENAQLEILNASIMDDGTQPTNNARILIGDISIAPYLLYTTKAAQLDMRIPNNTSYKNEDLVNNTALEPGTDIVYSISPDDAGASINNEGLVTAADGTQGEFTVTATWGDVSTSYVLTIISRNETSASFNGDAIVNLGLSDAVPAKTLSYTAGYDGTAEDITYSSNNSEVATVANDGTVTLAGGVGQAIITAHLAQTKNYKAAEASYIIQVTDDGASVQVERFSAVPNGNAAAHTNQKWEGDLFDWHTTQYGGVRKNGDKFPSDNTDAHTGIWMGIPDVTSTYATLQSNEAVEGGIKHMSFYWEQWGTESEHILNPVVYIKTGDNAPVQKASVEYMPTGSPVAANRMLIGINNIQSNSQLIIRNESHKSDGSRVNGQGRIILDEIHITPYLLYTNKEETLYTRNSLTYTNNGLINNTTGDAVAYSIAPTGKGATIGEESGEVTATDETEGDFVITATWGEVTTTYTLHIISRTATTASFANAIVSLALGTTVPANTLTPTTEGYAAEIKEEGGVISYESNNIEVATVSGSTISLAGGVGQATITATLPQTTNFKGTTASYIIQVTDDDENVQVEAFSGISNYKVSDIATNPIWNGDLFDWRVAYSVRRNNDVFPSDGTKQGTWMGIPDPSSDYGTLQSKEAIEGGIKHMSFYWEQWGTESEHILNPVVYIKTGDNDPVQKASVEYMPTGSPVAANRMLIGINDIQSNSQVIIRNESHKSDGSRVNGQGRIILDEIHITPYLLYTTKAHTITLGESYTNNDIINNTGGNNITYSLENNEEEEASISGATVTGLKPGEVTVKATWDDGGAYTWYTLTIVDKADAGLAFTNSVVKVRSNAPAVSNPFTRQTTADVTFSSSNSAVAEVGLTSGFIKINGEGTAVISAHSDANAAYKEGEVSYTLYVMPTNWYMETFSELSKMCIVAPGANTCATEPVTDELDYNVEWTYWLGGGNIPIFGNNAMYLRARKSDETCDYGYLKSEAVAGGLSSLSFQWNQGGNESAISNYNIIVKVNGEEVGSITAEGKKSAYTTPQEFSVTGLQYTGDVVIEIINETAYTGTDNRGRFVIDNIEWIGYTVPVITLNEVSDNSEVLSTYAGNKVDVEFTRSALVADVWNTLCLPFAIAQSEFGTEVDVQRMCSAELAGDELTVGFAAHTGDLEAGVPYLIKPASGVTMSGTYINKTITETASAITYNGISLQGIFNQKELTANDTKTLFVSLPNEAGDNLFYSTANATMPAFRAYIQLPNGGGAAPKRARFVVNQKEVVTGIESVQHSDVRVQKIIRDGQLFIIRDGKMYNAQGIQIR